MDIGEVPAPLLPTHRHQIGADERQQASAVARLALAE
jgi:hypothetical protein